MVLAPGKALTSFVKKEIIDARNDTSRKLCNYLNGAEYQLINVGKVNMIVAL